MRVFVDLYRKTRAGKRHAEERVALAREQAAGGGGGKSAPGCVPARRGPAGVLGQSPAYNRRAQESSPGLRFTASART